MIANIVDKRRHRYRWRKITAIMEATWHDNSVEDSDQSDAVRNANATGYEALEAVSLADAVAWANKADGEVTLFLYDAGEGTSLAKGF